MCEFVSWKEYNGEIYFLVNGDLETKDGQKLLLPDVKSDICGHGAIESYYPELKDKGENKECTDFSSPDNFPKEIVKALKQGKLSRIGIALDILNKAGKKKYEKIKQSAWDECRKIQQSAWDEYLKIEQSALAEYRKSYQSAWDEYRKIEQSAYITIVKQKKYRVKSWQ